MPLLTLVTRCETKRMSFLSAGRCRWLRQSDLCCGWNTRVSMALGMLSTRCPRSRALAFASLASHCEQATKATLYLSRSLFLRRHTFAATSFRPPPPGRYWQLAQPCSKLRQPSVRWQMPVAGHMSCMVHTTGLPLCRIFWMLFSESMP